METTNSIGTGLRELSKDEIAQVSGGVIFVDAALIKVGAWALGATFGAGLVVGIKHALE